MGIAGLVLAVFTSGYILGVWAACIVLRQPQKVYEDGVPVPNAGARAIARAVAAGRRR